MTNHRIHYAGLDPSLQARCSCKRRSPIGTRSEVEDWFIGHLQDVARVRAHLGSRNPSLKSQYDWFVKQADDVNNDADDRALWRKLADELDAFLVSKEPVAQEETLF